MALRAKLVHRADPFVRLIYEEFSRARSVNELARLIRTPPGTVYNWFGNGNTPYLSKMREVMDFFGYEIVAIRKEDSDAFSDWLATRDLARSSRSTTPSTRSKCGEADENHSSNSGS